MDNSAASGRVGSASWEEVCPVRTIYGNIYDSESTSSIFTCLSCSTGINSVGSSCVLCDPISSSSSLDSPLLSSPEYLWQEGIWQENVLNMDQSDSETDQINSLQVPELTAEPIDPNNNAQEEINNTLSNSQQEEAHELVEEYFPALDLGWELNVVSNTDNVAASNTSDPSAWTKNKYRSIVLQADVGLGKKLYHSSTNFVQGNNKTKKNVEIPTGALELDCYLTDQDDNPLGCLDHCAKLFEVNAPKQIIDLSTSRRFLFKVRMLCLPSYHQAAYFKLHIVVRNSDGDIIAATSVDIPKVHASRSAKRRQ